jgi:hypothetical protein
LTVIYNCFGAEATPMLFLKLEDYHKALKPFVIMLGYMPEVVEYGSNKIISSEIPLDPKTVKELREL